MEENEIKIGDQIWTTKNLDVETYRNGDVIPQVQDEEEWTNLTTGAWCYYENESDNGTTYGKLYNWYAVNDPRGLAPKGYHIPTDAEWTILTDNLGGEANNYHYMRFAGLPGGYRDDYGNFFGIGSYGGWWSSSESSADLAWCRDVNDDDGDVDRNDFNKQNGFSVSCLKD